SAQDSQVPVRRRAELGPRHRATGSALGARGLMGAGEALQHLVSLAVRLARRADWTYPRSGARRESVGHSESDWRAESVGMELRSRLAAAGWKSAVGDHQHADVERRGEPRF